MDQLKTKQQVIEKIKESSKILITVSDSPSVDALSAALGLTLLLDKQEKYATAIFSGAIPPAIAFLEPEKTFDNTTDSLRDFIIALDKNKADHLRMPQPEPGSDVVKIYITPYKTVITEDDLEFSQGDYNVELVIALGVDTQEDLDAALDNHGQILHDAEIITVTAGGQTSDLGGIDWHGAQASSLSEMVADLADTFKDEKKKPLLDASIATALLTGIVAETERFSNEHTTSGAMTIAAKLMAAGADQQLIATELQQSQGVSAPEPIEEAPDEAPVETAEAVLEQEVAEETAPAPKPPEDTGLVSIDHSGETLADLDRRVRHEDEVAEKPPVVHTTVALPDEITNPSLGGTLNATTEQAADDARREEASDKNRTILSHSSLGEPAPAPAEESAPLADEALLDETVHSAYSFDGPTDEPASIPNGQSFINSGEKVIQPPEASVETTVPLPVAQPVTPVSPVDLGLPLPPPLPDFSQGAPADFAAPALPLPPVAQPELLGDILAPEPQPVVMPSAPVSAYSLDPSLFTAQAPIEEQVPALAATQVSAVPSIPIATPQQVAAAPVMPQPTDSSQYQIPPQQ